MLKTFPIGGIHPSDSKISRDCPIETMPLPETVTIPLSQHIVGRRPAYRLFSEHHQVGAVGLGSLDGIHDFEFVVFESSDGII